MKTSEFSGFYEVEITKRPGERFFCWVRIYQLNADGRRLNDWHIDGAYCMTEFTGRIWARHVIRQLRKRDRHRNEDRVKKFIVDPNAKSKKARGDSWIKRTFTK